MGGAKFMKCRVTGWIMYPEDKPEFTKETRYCIWQKEKCPTTGNDHYQVFMKFFTGVSQKHIKQIWGSSCHILTCEASDTKNIEYASKEETRIAGPWEYGENCNERERCDLKEIKNDIMKGLTVDKLTIENPEIYHQYGRTLNRIETIALRKKYRNWMTECDWYYGPTGTDKSKAAFDMDNFNPDTHYVVSVEDSGFWNGYTGQETIIIDDFRGEIPYATLLKLIDRYPFYVKIKGCERVPFLGKKIIITSPFHPSRINWGLREGDSINQLLRRVKLIDTKGGSSGLESTSVKCGPEAGCNTIETGPDDECVFY